MLPDACCLLILLSARGSKLSHTHIPADMALAETVAGSQVIALTRHCAEEEIAAAPALPKHTNSHATLFMPVNLSPL